MEPPKPTVVYLYTTFPKATETFMQREIIAMRAHGVGLRIYSLWGGGGSFRGLPVARFNKWRLLTLFWMIPYESWRRPEVLKQVLRGLFTRRPPSWINFWENMLGAGFACLWAREFRKDPPALIHATWGGAPATAAWLLWRLDGHRFSAAAHAYDIYEHGGDWWLRDKLEHAAFIHTSTEMGRRALIERGLPVERIFCIRRGLDRLAALKPLRASRAPLHLLCVARLVEKKGLDHQLRIYAALQAAGVEFQAHIVGEGPLRPELEKLAGHLGIAAQVAFTGHLPQHEVWTQLDWADVLLHTGVIAPSGDRDGLPNVIPEAMSLGTLVVTSPIAATTEAITEMATGLVAPATSPAAWVAALRRLSTDDALAEKLRAAAHRWVEENFDAHKNAERLLRQFERVMAASWPKFAMIYFDVTKAARSGHSSGLQRVSARLREALGAAVTEVMWDEGLRDFRKLERVKPAPGDWFVTAEVFSEEERPGFGEFIRSGRVRTAAIFHDAIPLKFPFITWPQSVARHPGYLKFLASFDRVWAVSEASRAELTGFWQWQGLEKTPPVNVLALGADFTAAPRVTQRPAPAAVPRLLGVGILEPRKNQVLLLDVCEELWAGGQRFELHLVGRVNPHFGAPILARIESLRGKFSGLRYHAAAGDDEVARLYAGARASVFPTMAEGCGLPLLESLWQGVPCVCSDLPVLRENADGGGCLTVAVNDRAAWKDALQRMLTDEILHERLAREAGSRTLPTWAAAAESLRAELS